MSMMAPRYNIVSPHRVFPFIAGLLFALLLSVPVSVHAGGVSGGSQTPPENMTPPSPELYEERISYEEYYGQFADTPATDYGASQLESAANIYYDDFLTPYQTAYENFVASPPPATPAPTRDSLNDRLTNIAYGAAASMARGTFEPVTIFHLGIEFGNAINEALGQPTLGPGGVGELEALGKQGLPLDHYLPDIEILVPEAAMLLAEPDPTDHLQLAEDFFDQLPEEDFPFDNPIRDVENPPLPGASRDEQVAYAIGEAGVKEGTGDIGDVTGSGDSETVVSFVGTEWASTPEGDASVVATPPTEPKTASEIKLVEAKEVFQKPLPKEEVSKEQFQALRDETYTHFANAVDVYREQYSQEKAAAVALAEAMDSGKLNAPDVMNWLAASHGTDKALATAALGNQRLEKLGKTLNLGKEYMSVVGPIGGSILITVAKGLWNATVGSREADALTTYQDVINGALAQVSPGAEQVKVNTAVYTHVTNGPGNGLAIAAGLMVPSPISVLIPIVSAAVAADWERSVDFIGIPQQRMKDERFEFKPIGPITLPEVQNGSFVSVYVPPQEEPSGAGEDEPDSPQTPRQCSNVCSGQGITTKPANSYFVGPQTCSSSPHGQCNNTVFYTAWLCNPGFIESADGTRCIPALGEEPPTVTLSADPSSVSSGGASTLSWTIANASSCDAGGGWSGTRSGPTGSEIISGITVTTAYALSCSNIYGTSVAPRNGFTDAVSLSATLVPPLSGFAYSLSDPILNAAQYLAGSSLEVYFPQGDIQSGYIVRVTGTGGGYERILDIPLSLSTVQPRYEEF